MKDKKVILLVMTFLIFIFSLALYFITLNNKNKLLKIWAEPYIDNKDEFVIINKAKRSSEMTDDYMILSNDDINEIQKRLSKIKLTGYESYEIFSEYLVTKNLIATLDDNIYDYFGVNDFRNINKPYYNLDNGFKIVKVSDDLKNMVDIIGSVPKKHDEVMISNYLADLFITLGIKDYNNDIFYPKDYNEIISYSDYLKFGNNKIKIVGIIVYDLSKYNKIKEIDFEKLDMNYDEYSSLYESLFIKAINIYKNIFVSSDFVDDLILETVDEEWKKTLEINGVIIPVRNENEYIKLLDEFVNDGFYEVYNNYDGSFIRSWKIEFGDLKIINNILLYVSCVLLIVFLFIVVKFIKSKQSC